MKLKSKVLLLSLPFIIMVLVNEFCRQQIKETPYGGRGVEFMNPELWVHNKCSWACHNSSAFCEKHHIKYLRPVKQYIDPIYFGIIRFLKASPNYALANLLFLAILWPLLMWYLLVRCIEMRQTIKKLKA